MVSITTNADQYQALKDYATEQLLKEAYNTTTRLELGELIEKAASMGIFCSLELESTFNDGRMTFLRNEEAATEAIRPLQEIYKNFNL